MKKSNKKITPEEIFKAEITHTPIEFSRLKDIFDIKDVVTKLEITKGESGILAKIKFENSGINSIVRLI